MADKAWLLNPSAIQKAKECIHLIQQELDIRIRLAHPDFLQLIKDHAEHSESRELQLAYRHLARMAGIDVDKPQQETATKTVTRMPFSWKKDGQEKNRHAVYGNEDKPEFDEDGYIHYCGRDYPRYNTDGLEFKGLYRGQARYG